MRNLFEEYDESMNLFFFFLQFFSLYFSFFFLCFVHLTPFPFIFFARTTCDFSYLLKLTEINLEPQTMTDI